MTRWTQADVDRHQAKRGMPDVSQPPFALPADEACEPVTITLAEAPQGKQRARSFTKPDGTLGHYTPENTRRYESRIRTAAWEAMSVGGKLRAPFEMPVEMVLRAVYPIPASWTKNKRQDALTGAIQPTGKPDLDNVVKAVSDSLNGIVYRDDTQITDFTARKRYGVQPLVVVTIRPITSQVSA